MDLVYHQAVNSFALQPTFASYSLGWHLELIVTHQVNFESYLIFNLGSVVVSSFCFLCL